MGGRNDFVQDMLNNCTLSANGLIFVLRCLHNVSLINYARFNIGYKF